MKSEIHEELDLRTTVEVAEYLQMSPRTLEGWRRKGYGPPYIRLGKARNSKVVYSLCDLKRWLKACAPAAPVRQLDHEELATEHGGAPTRVDGKSVWRRLLIEAGLFKSRRGSQPETRDEQ